MDPTKPQAFLSYTRFDDRFLKGGISNLRERLELAVQARTGKPFNIFQDVDDIKPSDAWRKKLDQAIQASQLFIPILTPCFFTSTFCRNEASSFLAYEARAGQEGLILPIYLIDSDRLNDEKLRESDEIARQLLERQHADWRSLRFNLNDSETLPRIDELAWAIASVITKTHSITLPPVKVVPDLEEKVATLKAEVAERDQLVEAERARSQELQEELVNREAKEEAKRLTLEKRLSAREAEVAERDQLIEAERARSRKLQEELANREEEEEAKRLALEEMLSAREAEVAERDQLIEAECARHQELEAQLVKREQEAKQLAEDRAVFKGRSEEVAALRQEIETLRRRQNISRKVPKTHERYGEANRHELKGSSTRLWRAIGILSALLVGGGGGFWLARDDITSGKSTGHVEQDQMRLKGSGKQIDNKPDQKGIEAIAEPDGFNIRTDGLIEENVRTLIEAEQTSGDASGEASPPTAAAKAFRDCDDCPEMVVIPGGSFLMGSLPSEANFPKSETPRHKVDVRSFALGKYELTFAEWDACVTAGGCEHKPLDKGWGRDSRPVINVSWRDAQQYVDWLSRKTGKKYRLPSEAEWEYAARAESETNYHWGVDIGEDNANCDGCRRHGKEKRTEVVGSFGSNRFGLYDIHGNVWEWVEDSWHKDYVGAPSDGRAWVSPSTGKRVLRGGSWYNEAKYLRSARRIFDKANSRNDGFGFRIARELN